MKRGESCSAHSSSLAARPRSRCLLGESTCCCSGREEAIFSHTAAQSCSLSPHCLVRLLTMLATSSREGGVIIQIGQPRNWAELHGRDSGVAVITIWKGYRHFGFGSGIQASRSASRYSARSVMPSRMSSVGPRSAASAAHSSRLCDRVASCVGTSFSMPNVSLRAWRIRLSIDVCRSERPVEPTT